MGKTLGIKMSKAEREQAISKFMVKLLKEKEKAVVFKTPHEVVKSDITVKALLDKTATSMCGLPEINLNPIFQRGFVWGQDKEDALLNTILEGGQIPSLTFGKVRDKNPSSFNRICCVDGGNRIQTLLRFINNKRAIAGLFCRDEDDGSVSVDSTKTVNLYIGKKFKDLPVDVQNKILNYKFSFIIEEVEKENDLTNIFLRLNCGGVDMDFGQILIAKYRETEFGKAILNFIETETGRVLLGRKRVGKVSIPSLFLRCSGIVATASDFMRFVGRGGADQFLGESSATSSKEADNSMLHFKKAVEVFNKYFSDFEFYQHVFEKNGAKKLVTCTFSKQEKVKTAIISVLCGIDDLDFVIKNHMAIGENLVQKLLPSTVADSILLNLLTVQTTMRGRREQAMMQIRECFGI